MKHAKANWQPSRQLEYWQEMRDFLTEEKSDEPVEISPF